MKRIWVFLLAAMMFPVAASAQDDLRRKNTITLTTLPYGFNTYNRQKMTFMSVVGLEYDRALRDRLSFSLMAQRSTIDWQGEDDVYMDALFLFAGAKVNYTLPLVSDWMSLRGGIGAGVGAHSEESELTTVPHLVADLYLVLRASRRFDFRISPLVLAPSQFIFGSDIYGTYFYWPPMGTFGVSVKF